MGDTIPPPVAEAGLLFRRPEISNDSAAMRQIVRWGHEQIDVFYPDDPIRAPLNIVRRTLAHMEWDRVVRTEGRNLRGAVASTVVKDLEFEVLRRQTAIAAQDAETRRREAEIFNGQQRLSEQEAMADIGLRIAEAQRRLDFDLSQKAEDAASRRRIDERINDAEQDIAVLTAQAVAKTMGSSSPEKTLEAVRLVNNEIASIRGNGTLSNDDKHLQIKTLLETLPQMLRGLRSQDV